MDIHTVVNWPERKITGRYCKIPSHGIVKNTNCTLLKQNVKEDERY